MKRYTELMKTVRKNRFLYDETFDKRMKTFAQDMNNRFNTAKKRKCRLNDHEDCMDNDMKAINSKVEVDQSEIDLAKEINKNRTNESFSLNMLESAEIQKIECMMNGRKKYIK